MYEKKELQNFFSKNKLYNLASSIPNHKVSQPMNIFDPLKNGQEYLRSTQLGAQTPQKIQVSKFKNGIVRKRVIHTNLRDHSENM